MKLSLLSEHHGICNPSATSLVRAATAWPTPGRRSLPARDGWTFGGPTRSAPMNGSPADGDDGARLFRWHCAARRDVEGLSSPLAAQVFAIAACAPARQLTGAWKEAHVEATEMFVGALCGEAEKPPFRSPQVSQNLLGDPQRRLLAELQRD